MLVKLAFRNLWRNKSRTLISAAAVFFAVIFALLMRSMQYGTYDNMIKNVVGQFAGYIKVNENGFWQEKSLDNTLLFSNELQNKILNTKNVKDVIPRLETFALAANEDLTKGTIVIGVEPEKEKFLLKLEEKLVEGKIFNKNDNTVLISKGLSEYFNLKLNDTLVLISQGFAGSSATGKYNIAGIIKMGTPDVDNNLVLMPLQEAQLMYNAEERLTSLVPILSNVRRLDATVKDLQKAVGENYEVLGWKKLFPELIQLIEVDNKGGMVFVFILYIIIAFGIFSTIIMMTNERIYEFGVLISIGMKRRVLIAVMFLEAIFIGLIGVIAGLILGVPILTYFFYNPIPLTGNIDDFVEKYNMEPVLNFSLNPEIFLTQGMYVFIIAVVLSCYPMFKILRLNLINALRG